MGWNHQLAKFWGFHQILQKKTVFLVQDGPLLVINASCNPYKWPKINGQLGWFHPYMWSYGTLLTTGRGPPSRNSLPKTTSSPLKIGRNRKKTLHLPIINFQVRAVGFREFFLSFNCKHLLEQTSIKKTDATNGRQGWTSTHDAIH